MISQEEKYELIDKHLNGSLTSQEQEVYDHLISTDSSFAEDVQDFSISNEMVLDFELSSLKNKVAQDLLLRRKRKAFKKYVMGGLALLSIVGVVVFQGLDDETPNTENSTTQTDLPDISIKEKSINKTDNIKNTSNEKTYINVSESMKDTSLSADKPVDTLVTEVNAIIVTGEEPVSVQDTVESTNAEKMISPPTKESVNPCDTASLAVSITAKPTCTGRNDGSITIDAQGGLAPYTYSKNGGISYQKGSTFHFLTSDAYEVIIKDKNECISGMKLVDVKEKVCQTETAFVFNPDIEKWTIPADNGSFTISIKDQSGMQVYSKQYEYNDTVTPEWDGRDSNGNILNQGFYIFVIQNNDGTVSKGSVTIIK